MAILSYSSADFQHPWKCRDTAIISTPRPHAECTAAVAQDLFNLHEARQAGPHSKCKILHAVSLLFPSPIPRNFVAGSSSPCSRPTLARRTKQSRNWKEISSIRTRKTISITISTTSTHCHHLFTTSTSIIVTSSPIS